MSVSEATAAKADEKVEQGVTCVIDLGEHSRRRVRRLRRGEGRLMERVEDAIAAGQFRPAEPVAIVRAFLVLMLSLGEFEAADPLRAYLPDFLVNLFADGVRVHAAGSVD